MLASITAENVTTDTIIDNTTEITLEILNSTEPFNENSTTENSTSHLTDLVELKNNTLQSNISFRLPENIIPDLYIIEVKTYLEDDFHFEGRVNIRFYCFNDTSEIILHAKDLNISESEVILSENGTGDVIEISEHWYHIDNWFYIIKLANPILAGQTYLLDIPYCAYLRETLHGYYKSNYIDKKTGATR